MKIILSLALISCTNIGAQVETTYSIEVEEYINTLKEYALEYDQIPTSKEFSIGNQELNVLMLKMYNAIASDAEGYTNYLAKVTKYQEEQIKSGKMDKNKPSIGDFHKLVIIKLEEQYSRKFITLITTPYFFKVKIVEKTPGTYTTYGGLEFNQVLVKAEIEEILKGEQKYKIGEQIIFIYFDINTCNRNYKGGNTYLIPFTVSSKEYSTYEGLIPQWFDCTGNYPISEEIISILDDYFGFGKILPWNEFKLKFQDQFILQ